ncbi:hypothetical protein ACGFW5_32540 [Streptomyces sp. NPDC048416]
MASRVWGEAPSNPAYSCGPWTLLAQFPAPLDYSMRARIRTLSPSGD